LCHDAILSKSREISKFQGGWNKEGGQVLSYNSNIQFLIIEFDRRCQLKRMCGILANHDYNHLKRIVTIFLHIPKTAGTTFNTILQYKYPLSQTVDVHQSRYNPLFKSSMFQDHEYIGNEIRRVPAEIIQSVRLIRGHSHFGVHKYFDMPFQYMAFFRNPVDRLISWYYFLKENPDQASYIEVAGHSTFEDFIQYGKYEVNIMTRRLCSDDSFQLPDSEKLDHAKENIERHFKVFGLTSSFNESLILFMQKLGWKEHPHYSRTKITRKRPAHNEISDYARIMISEKNSQDIELYRWIKTKYDETIRQSGQNFHEEVTKFEKMRDLINLGRDEMSRRDFNAVITRFNTVLETHPNCAEAKKQIGIAYSRLSEYQLCLQYFKEVIDSGSFDGELLRECVLALKHLGMHEDAAYFEQFLLQY